MRLDQLKKGQFAIIEAVCSPQETTVQSGSLSEDGFVLRLLSMGFTRGTRVQLVFHAPIVHDPIAIQIRGTLMALRKSDARWIQVRTVNA
jgi:Fe2+ transport system protein FeoA